MALVKSAEDERLTRVRALERAVAAAVHADLRARADFEQCGWYFNKKTESTDGLRTRHERDERLLQWVDECFAERAEIADALATANGVEARILEVHLNMVEEKHTRSGVARIKVDVTNRLASMVRKRDDATACAREKKNAEENLQKYKDQMSEMRNLALEAERYCKDSEAAVARCTEEGDELKTRPIRARREAALCRREKALASKCGYTFSCCMLVPAERCKRPCVIRVTFCRR